MEYTNTLFDVSIAEVMFITNQRKVEVMYEYTQNIVESERDLVIENIETLSLLLDANDQRFLVELKKQGNRFLEILKESEGGSE